MRARILLLLSLLGCTDVKISHVPIDADNDGFDSTVDCDDAHATVNPDADEVCDGLDNDCDDAVDEDPIDGDTWYRDADVDDHGDVAVSVVACEAPDGYVARGDDCDDANSAVNPGAMERCNAIDDDCDGTVDEEAVDASGWYADADSDGYGIGDALVACAAPEGYAADDQDCNDADPAVHPGADESDCTDPTDYNCDGVVAWADDDLDGVPACEDCDDGDPNRSPWLIEVCDAHDVDEDCDGRADDEDPDVSGTFTWYYDGDRDRWGGRSTVDACDRPAGYAVAGGDCDDSNPDVSPSGVETCNGIDDDCDASIDEAFDSDGDGLADCFDTEVCDGLDNDGDGLVDDDDPDVTGTAAWYEDGDGDHWGSASTAQACILPPGYAVAGGDCDDSNPDVSPGGVETCNGIDDDCDASIDEAFDSDGDGLADCFDTEVCDGLDNDGDGLVDDDDPDVAGASNWYADSDGDTFGDPGAVTAACEAPATAVADATDCDDTDGAVFPGAPEVCDDGVDSDCDGGDTAPCRYSGTYALEGTTDAAVKLYGEGSLDQFGYGLAAGMDLNGDGIGDLVVGAWGYDDGTRYGAAYAYGGPLAEGSFGARPPAAAIVSGATHATYAYAADLFPVSDIDADGHDEWATVHYNASPASTALYLYAGESTSGAMVSDADALLVETGTGAFPAGNFAGADGGWWLTNSWDTSYRGAATLYTGTTPGDRIEGEADDDLAATWVAGGDDYDGDGISDVAIGTPRHDGGVVYIVLGPTTGDLSLAAADARIRTGGLADDFGRDLDAIGDIDGDGLADLMAGAPGANSSAGAVYVFTGVDPTRSSPDNTVSDASIVLQGDVGEQLAGVENQSVSAVGDLDLDGELDFLVSSAHATVGTAANAGRAWLLYGPRSGAVDVSVDADATFDGDGNSDGCGSDGALVDLDGDGWLDVVLGCTRGDEGAGVDVGTVYIFYGG